MWTLSDDAELRIGGAQKSAEDEFATRSGFVSAVAWPDGGLLVLDGVRLRRFTRDGREAWRVGARGQGPWEFLSLASACRTRGDTLIAFDAGTRRLSILGGDGTRVRLVEVASLGVVPPHACLGNGAVLAVSPSGGADDGVLMATVRSVTTAGTPRDSMGPLPFMAHGRLSVLVAHDDWLWSAAPWQSVLRRIRADGTTIEEYRFSEPERTLSEAEAARSRVIEGVMGSAGDDPVASRRAPWFDDAVPGHGGTLWLRSFDVGEVVDAEWVGIGPNGELIARFTIPRSPEIKLVSITDLGVWLLRRDAPDGHVLFEFRRFVKE